MADLSCRGFWDEQQRVEKLKSNLVQTATSAEQRQAARVVQIAVPATFTDRIQLQPRLYLPHYMIVYGTQEKCEAALERDRWPEGFILMCLRCGKKEHGMFYRRRHRRYQFRQCRPQSAPACSAPAE